MVLGYLRLVEERILDLRAAAMPESFSRLTVECLFCYLRRFQVVAVGNSILRRPVRDDVNQPRSNRISTWCHVRGTLSALYVRIRIISGINFQPITLHRSFSALPYVIPTSAYHRRQLHITTSICNWIEHPPSSY